MSIFNITDATPAGALCNAMDAARESDHRAARHRPSASAESANDAPAVKVLRPAIREILGEAWRRIGWAYRAETA